ncbi:bacteriohopanetetrol glucosamine biosynthesis glycosyltransferase HpnI [Alloacidobacterium dinghuense]|uniref:Bacteriohopanetetrol glucosamine biosynthesis glycosyltransferase HpnI n=1 Tax=Alloacidobacterium dinghuense TaxID=2763107 RepID=A0A7G8BFZ7_9BACT|nr:bacteriohopanetetrol glucosamine biosynthesis glycosyltransferase HpnI [Alloacidobacterium dinghuense]QNI31467.1 bacteriohopanetetrol glucosamine biosynthesis glycosyltransferase HpnI [Alloacidobacterium dinghuense]
MLAVIVESITSILALCGLGFYLAALWSARDFVRRKRKNTNAFHPPVSILKSLKGFDHDMYASFVSHCRQQYAGDYEILFGVSSMEDASVAAVEQLKAEFPQIAIRLVLCPEVLGANGKVSNLALMVPQASFAHILINDSDIKVSPRYLARVVAPFANAEVGMVTALYRGRSHQTIGSKMEAIGISTDFAAGVLTARKLEGGIRFGLGSTLAMSREALDAIGGLRPLVDHLADDYELGARIAAKGYRVELADEVVETTVPAYTFRQFLAHQLRWARGMRDVRKKGYAGVVFTFGLPWAVLNVLAAGASLPSVALLSLVCAARVTVALAIGVGVLRDLEVLRDLWLLLPRDMIALGVWVWSYAGNTVTWRDQTFALKDGRMQRLTTTR